MNSGEIVDSPDQNFEVLYAPIFFNSTIFHHPAITNLFTVQFFYLKVEQHYKEKVFVSGINHRNCTQHCFEPRFDALEAWK